MINLFDSEIFRFENEFNQKFDQNLAIFIRLGFFILKETLFYNILKEQIQNITKVKDIFLMVLIIC